jgi:hypothetical protein
MKTETAFKELEDNEESILMADGFDEALIGVGRRCGQPDIAVYDESRCISILEKQGMDHDEAVEYFEFNVVGAWVGPQTPMFVEPSGIMAIMQRH